MESAIEKKAFSLQILNVEGLISYCDRFVICSGSSSRQVRAIADNVMQILKKEHNLLPIGVEGRGAEKWVLVDFGDVVLHVFTSEARGYYSLEELWMDAPQIPLSEYDLEEPEDSPKDPFSFA